MQSTHTHLEIGSHFPVLLHCLHFTEGPVLELGCGCYSTPLFSLYSQSRYCRTIESDSTWFGKVKNFYRPFGKIEEDRGHEMICTEYNDAVIDDRNWTFVFVDHKADQRAESIRKLKHLSKFIIVHDSQRQELIQAMSDYRYRYDFRKIFPYTSVVSETDHLKWLENAMSFY